jgi:hypothetical protein
MQPARIYVGGVERSEYDVIVVTLRTLATVFGVSLVDAAAPTE